MDVNYYQLLTNQMIAFRLWLGFPIKATQPDPGWQTGITFHNTLSLIMNADILGDKPEACVSLSAKQTVDL